MFTKIINLNLIKILVLLSVIFITLNTSITYAAVDCSNYESVLNEPESRDALAYIACPVIRIINAALVFVSAAFVVVLLYGGIKMSLSLGDPKALQGAKDTWTWAVIGTFFVLLALVAVTLMFKLLGVSDFSFADLLNFDESLNKLWESL